MKRRVVTLLIVLAVLGAIIAGWALSQQGATASVDTVRATQQPLSVNFAASGKLVAPQATSVSAPANGTLASVAVTDGQRVEAGQLLATMDAAPLDLAVTRAQAQAAQARAMPTGTDRLNNARTAAIRAADAALEAARADRAKVEVKAPVAGTVQFTSISLAPGTPPLFETHAGAAVTSGVPLFTIVDLAQLRFEAQVDETDIARVEPDQAVQVVLDAFPGEQFLGKVTSIRTSSVTTSTGGVAFPVQVALDPSEARLFVGMSGDARVQVAEVADAVVVPARAVVREGVESYLWVVRDGVAHKQQVDLGPGNDLEVQVKSLAPDSVVAVGNLTALKEGAKVNVVG